MAPQGSTSQLSANKISLIIIGSSVVLTLVIGLVIASGKDDRGPAPTSLPETNGQTSTESEAADTGTAAASTPPFASFYHLYSMVRQGKLEKSLADPSTAQDWAIYSGSDLHRDSTRKAGGHILGQLQTIGRVGTLQYVELPNFTFHTPLGEKTPGMYADQEEGLSTGTGWRIPFTTPASHQGDLVITTHYSAYRTNLTLKLRNTDGTLIASSPFIYNRKAVNAIRTTLKNLQPSTSYSLELVVDSYFIKDGSKASSPQGLGINAVVVE